MSFRSYSQYEIWMKGKGRGGMVVGGGGSQEQRQSDFDQQGSAIYDS